MCSRPAGSGRFWHLEAAKKPARSINVIPSSRRLTRRPLGHPCAMLCCAVPPVSTPARHAHSYAQPHRPCPSRRNLIVPCSIACPTPSCSPIHSQRHRAMLTRVRNLIAPAHSVRTPSRHAHSRAECHRALPSTRNVLAPCFIVCESSSRMPMQLESCRVMLYHVGNVMAGRNGWPNNRM